MRVQMLERETKREKILEARQKELRLKERSRSEQSRDDEARDLDRAESPQQLIARAESDFYSMVEAERRRRMEVSRRPPGRRSEKHLTDAVCSQERGICEEKAVTD